MKKLAFLIAVGLGAGVCMSPALAQERGHDGMLDYANLQLAFALVSGFKSGVTLVATGGHELGGMPGWAIEGELTKNITKPDDTGGGVTREISYYTLAGYGVYRYPLGEATNLRVRAGLLYENVDTKASGLVSASDTTSQFGLSFGAGVTYHLTPNMNLIGEYTVIEADISHVSAGIQYSF